MKALGFSLCDLSKETGLRAPRNMSQLANRVD